MVDTSEILLLVMPGLDPGIHHSRKVDCRVRPGNDEGRKFARIARAALRDWQDTIAGGAPVQPLLCLPE
jgi:hypothetical protein